MKKNIVVLLYFLFVSSSLMLSAKGTKVPDTIASHEATLKQLITVAHTQEEIMNKLLKTQGVKKEDLQSLSLTEVDEAIRCLEEEYNALEDACEKLDPSGEEFSQINNRYLPLLLELQRRLKAARIEYHNVVKDSPSMMRKAVIPLGVAGGVASTILLLSWYYRDLRLDITDAVKYGLLAGGIVAVIVYREEIINGVKKVVEVCTSTGKGIAKTLASASPGTRVALITGAGLVIGGIAASRALKLMSPKKAKSKNLSDVHQGGGCFGGFGGLNVPD